MSKRSSPSGWGDEGLERGAKRARVVFAGSGDAAGDVDEIVIEFVKMGFGNVVKEAVRTMCYAKLYTRATAQSYVASGAWDASKVAEALKTLDVFYPKTDWEIRGCGVLSGLSHAAEWFQS